MELFFILLFALVGGYISKRLKLSPIIGYIVAGVVANSFFNISTVEIDKLAELGSILLLFSIGLELSISKMSTEIKKVVVAGSLQIILTTILLFFILNVFGFSNLVAIILALGFSLSSTAVVVKTLMEKGESETIHGKLMIGWLLVQDLAVIPMMIILPILAGNKEGALLLSFLAISKAVFLISASVLLGKHIVPFLIHKVAILNSRELMVLTSVALAVGTALGVTFFGISASLGAFIAGFVISESQENHAVFAETRPLRDLFVALFFVTLGFFVSINDIFSNFFVIIAISLLVIIVKILVIIFVSLLLKVRGKTTIISAFGLSQVGEFSFILFSAAALLKLMPEETASLGIVITLVTLILTPFINKLAYPVWHFLSTKFNVFKSNNRNQSDGSEITNHIIICGYGRVGGWVGKALKDQGIEFVVIDLDPNVIKKCLDKGITAIHGDPIEKEVLKIAGLMDAKAVVLAIPDRISQESVISHIQTLSPDTRIISRVHLDEDYEKLKILRVHKLVQPEFEAAASIIKNIFVTMGKSKIEIDKSLKTLRQQHAKI